MLIARKQLIRLIDTLNKYCISGGVRRTFLYSEDELSDKIFERRHTGVCSLFCRAAKKNLLFGFQLFDFSSFKNLQKSLLYSVLFSLPHTLPYRRTPSTELALLHAEDKLLHQYLRK